MIDSVNRFVLWLLGIVLVGASVFGLQARDDLFDIDLYEPGTSYERAADEVTDQPWLWWPIIIGGAVLVALLSLFWLRSQFARRGGAGIGTQTVQRSATGELDVEPSSIADAVAADFRTLDGVHASSVRILELVPTTVVRARLELLDDVDVQAVRRDAEAVLDRLRTVAGSDEVNAELRLRLASRATPRVV